MDLGLCVRNRMDDQSTCSVFVARQSWKFLVDDKQEMQSVIVVFFMFKSHMNGFFVRMTIVWKIVCKKRKQKCFLSLP